MMIKIFRISPNMTTWAEVFRNLRPAFEYNAEVFKVLMKGKMADLGDHVELWECVKCTSHMTAQ